MTETVLDASAILADLWDEPGAEAVRATLPDAVVSAVNLAEVVTKLIDHGLSGDEVRSIVDGLAFRIAGASRAEALRAGLMRAKTRRAGISLGDLFCLALAQELGAPTMTADQAWQRLDLDVEITLIR